MGLSDDDLSKVTLSSLVPEPALGPYLRRPYRPGAFQNGIAYLFAAAAVVLPLLGLVAIVLAVRGIRQERRGAWLALAVAALATTVGVVLWITVMRSAGPSSSPGL